MVDPQHLPLSVQAFHSVFVRIPREARCVHGVYLTQVERTGVRIACSKEHDCWLVKWDRWPNA